jgi:hypothetical protein
MKAFVRSLLLCSSTPSGTASPPHERPDLDQEMPKRKATESSMSTRAPKKPKAAKAKKEAAKDDDSKGKFLCVPPYKYVPRAEMR